MQYWCVPVLGGLQAKKFSLSCYQLSLFSILSTGKATTAQVLNLSWGMSNKEKNPISSFCCHNALQNIWKMIKKQLYWQNTSSGFYPPVGIGSGPPYQVFLTVVLILLFQPMSLWTVSCTNRQAFEFKSPSFSLDLWRRLKFEYWKGKIQQFYIRCKWNSDSIFWWYEVKIT